FGYGVRWKTNYETEHATASALGEGREAFKVRGDRLELELAECNEALRRKDSELVELKARIAALEAQPDLTQVLHLVGEQSVREDARAEVRSHQAVEKLGELFLETLDRHDERAATRQESILQTQGLVIKNQERMLGVLSIIADRLG